MVRELEFKVLCSLYSDDIYRYARSFLGNASDAEDATQEVLLRIWNHLPRLNLLHPKAWVLQITRNHCLDQLRRRASRPVPVLVANETLHEHADELAPIPGEGADADFLHGEIQAALMALSEDQRSVFVLYEVNGLRYREIATTLSLPLNTVKVYLSRAREKLQQLLNHHEPWIRKSKD